MTDLYIDENGQSIVTHSMLKSARRCWKMTQYKYYERLKPRVVGQALYRGKWVHGVLESHYKGGDWKAEHQQWCNKYSKLFDEEKAKLGDLPNEVKSLMRGYFWHYHNDEDWKVLETELTIETPITKSVLFRCRVDNMVETPYGLYLVDHKSHRTLPGHEFRLRDTQSPLYIWAARKAGFPVVGFIWNYLRTRPPAHWRFKKDGNLYAKIGETDYPTARSDLIAAGFNWKDEKWRERLDALKSIRYEHGAPQTSPFFRRDWMDKDDDMIAQVVREARHTIKRIREYPFHKTAWVERSVDRACDWCDFQSICTTELSGGNVDFIRRKQYRESDPMDYYNDKKEFSDV
jgi:PD-(D/E)XK nuclease superfamily